MSIDVTNRTVLVSAAGGILDIVGADGEVLAAIAVPPGRVKARSYFDLLPQGAHFEVAEGLAVIEPRSAVVVTDYGDQALLSDANPDFQPTRVSEMEAQLRSLVRRASQATTRLERRAAAQDDVLKRRGEAEAAAQADPAKAAADKAAKDAADAVTE